MLADRETLNSLLRTGVLLAAVWILPSGAAAQDENRLDVDELEAQVANLFETTCARSGCHGGPVPQQEMHLGPAQFHAATVDVPSLQRPGLMRVDPGDPDSSYLVMKVKGHPEIIGAPMPLTGETLTEEEVDLIASWIAALSETGARRTGPTADAEPFPFDGWKVLNLPTSRTLDAGSWLFLIGHRFNPKIWDGYDAFFGLDGSGIIYLSLGYAVTDRLLVALGRSNAADNAELQVRFGLAKQGGESRWPIGVGVQSAVNWITEKPPGEDRFRGDAFKFTGQVSFTRALGDRIGLAVVPGILFNPAESVGGEDPLVTAGLAGRWRFHRNLSIVAEWVPIASGYTRTVTFENENRFDSWGGGLEINTGGHVFQIVVSNSVGLATDQYLRGGDLDIRDGDLRLGFNIFRILNF